MLRRTSASAALLILFAAMLSVRGCAATSQTGNINLARADYDAGRYKMAFDRAASAQYAASGEERDHAAYLAGLSAYQLGEYDEAERRLLMAAASADRDIAGRSKATLGSIRMKQSRPRDAGILFNEAATMLTGEAAATAAYQAGLAFQQSGDVGRARTHFLIASGTTDDASLRSDARQELTRTGFTLQVGLFHEADNARQAAESARALAERHRVDPVRTVESVDQRGRRIYIVQMGVFLTRQAAERARREMNKLEFIVKPITRAE